jgi:hypothetical protein
MTVTYVRQKNLLLLGKKLVRIGKGWWNGFGGNIESGELIIQAAVRELWEETRNPDCPDNTGIIPTAIYKCGEILITHNYKPEEILLHYFLVTESEGEAYETDEMMPFRYSIEDPCLIPFDSMWPSDIHILPRFLDGEKLIGQICYNQDKKIVSIKLQAIQSFPCSTDLKRL